MSTPRSEECANEGGPLGPFFRYSCDSGAGTARYDDLADGKENPIDVSQVAVSMNGIEQSPFPAIADGREPRSYAGQPPGEYRTPHSLEKSLPR